MGDSTSFDVVAASPKIGARTMKLSRPVKSLTSDDPEIERSGDETRLEESIPGVKAVVVSLIRIHSKTGKYLLPINLTCD